jgi:hypothetical protein
LRVTRLFILGWLIFVRIIYIYIYVEKTQSRIQWFSALSIIILVMTSLWQLIYLRKYFTDKKIL